MNATPNGQNYHRPVFVRLIKCPWCLSPWTRVYKTEGTLQRRRCDSCQRTFKAVHEAPDRPRPEATPSTPKPRKKQ